MDTDEGIAGYLREFVDEDETLRAARERSTQRGIPAVPPTTGALVSFLARLVDARHVVEIGSGGGYSGLWLLRGMGARGSLTTIESDPDTRELAQATFAQARVSDRVRSMLGPALEILPRLADQHYDLVFLDAVKAEYPEYLTHARRLLRVGGLVVADDTLRHGRVADDTVTDPDTEGVRRFNRGLRDDPRLQAVLLPVDDGVTAAVQLPGEGRA